MLSINFQFFHLLRHVGGDQKWNVIHIKNLTQFKGNLFEFYSVRIFESENWKFKAWNWNFLVVFNDFFTSKASHDLFVTHLTHLQWRHSTRCLNVSQTLLLFMFSWLKVLPLPHFFSFPLSPHFVYNLHNNFSMHSSW